MPPPVSLPRCGRLGQTALSQQRLRLGFPAAERHIGFLRSTAVARGIDVLVQFSGERGIENIAALLEGCKTVGVENF